MLKPKSEMPKQNPNLPPKEVNTIPNNEGNISTNTKANTISRNEKIKVALIFTNLTLGVLVLLLSSISAGLG